MSSVVDSFRMRTGRRRNRTDRSTRRPLHIVPPTDGSPEAIPLADDSLYRATAVGVSSDHRCSDDHDFILYFR
jgi:hypothetical protein